MICILLLYEWINIHNNLSQLTLFFSKLMYQIEMRSIHLYEWCIFVSRYHQLIILLYFVCLHYSHEIHLLNSSIINKIFKIRTSTEISLNWNIYRCNVCQIESLKTKYARDFWTVTIDAPIHIQHSFVLHQCLNSSVQQYFQVIVNKNTNVIVIHFGWCTDKTRSHFFTNTPYK